MAGREKLSAGKNASVQSEARLLLTAPAAFAPFTNRSPLFFWRRARMAAARAPPRG